MATSLELDFESWLSFKLKSLNTDENVIGSYITGILNGEETIDEKTEALEGILTEITENDISTHCHEIMERWRESRVPGDGESSNEPGTSVEEVEERLVRLMETNTKTKAAVKEYTDDEKKIREAILAQYAETSDQEFESDGDNVKKEESDLVKNTNAASVIQALKEKREKAKLDCQKKKEKDKEDREKQKQLKEDKKEKRKTQKGERRR